MFATSGFIIWIPLALLAVVVGVPGLAAAVSLRRATSRRRREELLAAAGGPASPDAAAAVTGYLGRIRRGRNLGLLAGLVLAVLVAALNMPLLAPLAVTAGYLGGVLASELTAPVPRRGPVRLAALSVRRPRDYAGGAQLAVAAGFTVATAAAAIALTARPYPEGVMLRCGSGEIGPWYYAWPSAGWRLAAIALALAGMAAAGLVLRRIAFRPAVLTQAGVSSRADELVRRGPPHESRAALALLPGRRARPVTVPPAS